MPDLFIDIGLYLCYAGCILGIAAAIVFPVLFFFKNPKNAKSTLIGIGAFALVVVVAFLLSSGELNAKYADLGITTETGSRIIGSGLITLYILGIGSITLAALSEILSVFK